MEAKDLLSLVFGRWDFFLNMWDAYKLVLLGLLVFGASQTFTFIRQSGVILIVVVVTFLGGAIFHLAGLLVVRLQWAALATAAKSKLAGDAVLEPIGAVLKVPTRNVVIAVHLIADVAVLIALFAIRWAIR